MAWKNWNIIKRVKKGDYIYAVVPEHPRAIKYGYVLEHIVVAENKIKRLLEAGEIVHHINGNKKDNSESNLVVMSESEHSRFHSSTGRTMISLVCKNCGKEFEREARNTYIQSGYNNSFCSRRCNGLYNGYQHK